VTPGRVHGAELHGEDDRVIAQLFLPGEEVSAGHSRAAEIITRVMALPAETVERLAVDLQRDFAARHPDTAALFIRHADLVSARLAETVEISEARKIVLGASFTAEFAVEGAALCNPSAVAHPDQSGLGRGELRVAIAVRAIGEGHLSSIGFAEAIVGPGRSWRFQERARPLWRAHLEDGDWSVDHFRAAVEHEGIVGEISHAVIRALPSRFTAADIGAAISALPVSLSARADSHRQIAALRDLASSTYRATFPPEAGLSQRVLTPVAADEHRGMEDARFVSFTDVDGTVGYRATYTAYNGRDIAPRLIVTPDLREFAIHRLTGDAAHNKGMALFPRAVDGRYLALSRSDGENISLAESRDGVIWTIVGVVHRPEEPWEIVQTGNCGAPIETAEGWIVLTHGVGPMRTYALGALLLDLHDPTIVRGRTRLPILRPIDERRDGYVPNVVYSCGGLIHGDVLWIPIGVGDSRIGVYSVGVSELCALMIT